MPQEESFYFTALASGHSAEFSLRGGFYQIGYTAPFSCQLTLEVQHQASPFDEPNNEPYWQDRCIINVHHAVGTTGMTLAAGVYRFRNDGARTDIIVSGHY